MTTCRQMIPIAALVIAAMAGVTAAAADGYTQYNANNLDTPLVVLEIGREEWTITAYVGGQARVSTYSAAEVKLTDRTLSIGKDLSLNDEGIHLPGRDIPANQIGEIRVEADSGAYRTALSFMPVGPSRPSGRLNRKADRISYWSSVAVERGEFIRGSVVAFFGDIDVHGEVNRDVVAINGDVHVWPGAVVRGDIIALNGAVKLDQEGSVYGAVRSSKGETTARRHRSRRWKERDGVVGVGGEFYYNRVDGAALMVGLEFDPPDSILPAFEVMGGYAFSSKRGRYTLGLTQTLLRGKVPIQLGGKVFRLLKSDDDKIIGNTENSIFALLVNEDWKDYYEAEGGYGFVRVNFLRWNTLEVGYLTEHQDWLSAHPKLWSLFGGKDFRGNFSSAPYSILSAHRSDFDDRLVTSLNLRLTVDSRDDEKSPKQGWYGYLAYENSPGEWNGEFDFNRFEAHLRRYQPLSRYLSLHLAASYGHADGSAIPLNRYFFLGGLGTIHGYRHKGFIGTEYMQVSGEYRFRIPHSDVLPFIQYDGGKIMDGWVAGDNAWYSSVGIGMAFEPNFKIFVAKRLDKADENPIIYTRFSAAAF